MLFKKKSEPKKIEKSIADGVNAVMPNSRIDQNGRGYNVFTTSQLYSIAGYDKDKNVQNVTIEQPLFYLTLDERLGVFRMCSPVHGLVTSRMNKISALKYNVVPDSKQEDMAYERLKNFKQIYTEYAGQEDMKYKVAASRIRMKIMESLPDVLPDLSNFNSALVRWKKRLDMQKGDRANEISDWLEQPNQDDNWASYVKKYVFDLCVHGAVAQYKEELDGVIENFYVLPGGTVFPVKNQFVGGYTAYVQVVQGMDPHVYYPDEVVMSNYIPSSARAYGFIPLEALINKVSESLLFDRLMADQADGTKPPSKMILVTDNNPFGDMNLDMKIPMDVDEQQRVEEKINTPTKNAIMTFSGNSAMVVDLSRENTMATQMQRQKDIREEVALVFNATNMEVNLTGSQNTSGRETSEVQMELAQGKGVAPLILQLEYDLNKRIIPFRFGSGYSLELEVGQSERENLELLQIKMASGLYSVNEVRRDDLNLDPFDGDEFEKPMGMGQGQQQGMPQQGMPQQNPMEGIE